MGVIPIELLYQMAESQQELFTARQAVQAGHDEKNPLTMLIQEIEGQNNIKLMDTVI